MKEDFIKDEVEEEVEKAPGENEEIINEKEQEELGLHSIKNTFEKNVDEGNTKFYYGALRSGQRLQYNGSIVIVGDVNSGAEVTVSGNIAILGALRGIAHAGATGNLKAVISAMEINTPQIRISNIVKEMEQEAYLERKIAMVKEGKIIIE